MSLINIVKRGGKMKKCDDEILKILEATACLQAIRKLAIKK